MCARSAATDALLLLWSRPGARGTGRPCGEKAAVAFIYGLFELGTGGGRLWWWRRARFSAGLTFLCLREGGGARAALFATLGSSRRKAVETTFYLIISRGRH